MIGLVFAVILLVILAWAAHEYLPGLLGMVVAGLLILLAAYLVVAAFAPDDAEAAAAAFVPFGRRLLARRDPP